MIIGNRYYWDDPEYGWYEVDQTVHERLQQIRDQINQQMHDYLVATGTPMSPPVITCTMADFPEDHVDFKDLWIRSEDGAKEPLVKYFQPVYEESKFDKYGHAILPTGLREITDDAISAARMQFPKSED